MAFLKRELTHDGTYAFKVILSRSTRFLRVDSSGVYHVEVSAPSASSANSALCDFIKHELHARTVTVTYGREVAFKKVYISGIPAHR